MFDEKYIPINLNYWRKVIVEKHLSEYFPKQHNKKQ